MFLAMMMAGQQTLEKELEQQRKELEKEREERKKNEDWLRNVDFPEIQDEEREEVEEHSKQAPQMAGAKRNAEGVVQGERTT